MAWIFHNQCLQTLIPPKAGHFRIFHGVEISFPWRGKRAGIFSMAWKNRPAFFHSVENPDF
jgi:hypothetical protein